MGYRHAIKSEGGAIDSTYGPLTGPQTLSAILVNVNTAPTTSESLTVTLDSVDGGEHDVVIYGKDLISTTSVALTEIDLRLDTGDALRVEYANTDARIIGVRLVLK
ncbi:hypothetical protein LCGC14_0386720 [marine sediment metagenome]|uniref:Uncharacterized protein n=1 Tax=marine sediment metagenome TaxID=412755 RepID=A0A0F9T6G4_9ZZZZ